MCHILMRRPNSEGRSEQVAAWFCACELGPPMTRVVAARGLGADAVWLKGG